MDLVEQLGPLRYPLTFVAALALSLYFTPVIRQGAIKYGVVDAPDGRLKVHDAPVAYLGGVAIYLSFLFALAFTHEFDERVLGLLLAASIIVMLGLFDDLKVLTPNAKLVGQAVATAVLVKADIMIRLAFLPDELALLLTFLWLLATTNAINLIDVSDALAGGVSFVASIFLFVVASWNGHTALAVLALALMGSTLGFLVFNRPPATIYLGDTGSMFLGFMLGALAMTNHYTFVHPWGALAPVLILGVPVFDTLFVMGVRLYRRLPVMQGSPDHFAVRLRRHGVRSGAIAAIGMGATAGLGGTALALCVSPMEVAWALLAGAAAVAATAAVVLLRMGRGGP
jgi:UDP-GlcNAc:undecaprenyl-phosphate GlcNAc-1-phosphate transferase